MDHHARMRQGEPLALGSAGEEDGAHRGRLAEAVRLDLRLDEARRMVTDTRLSMQDIALRCGFSSQMAFARAFRARFATTATALRATAT